MQSLMKANKPALIAVAAALKCDKGLTKAELVAAITAACDKGGEVKAAEEVPCEKGLEEKWEKGGEEEGGEGGGEGEEAAEADYAASDEGMQIFVRPLPARPSLSMSRHRIPLTPSRF